MHVRKADGLAASAMRPVNRNSLSDEIVEQLTRLISRGVLNRRASAVGRNCACGSSRPHDHSRSLAVYGGDGNSQWKGG
jgi:hypothetical protein